MKGKEDGSRKEAEGEEARRGREERGENSLQRMMPRIARVSMVMGCGSKMIGAT